MFKAIAFTTALLSTTVLACPGLHERTPERLPVQFGAGISKRQEGPTAAVACGDYDYTERGLDWAAECPSEWSLCGNGTMQTPIDLPVNQFAGTWAPTFAFPGGAAVPGSISNSGFGPKWSPDTNASVPTLTFGNTTLPLLQFHLHTPTSEHTFGGEYLRSEIHFVFADGVSPAAVVGVGLDDGDESTFWAEIFTQIDDQCEQLPGIDAPETQKVAVNVGFQHVFNQEYLGNYWTYRGSLTTPGCTEGLRWFVAGNVKTLDPVQFGRIERASQDSVRQIQATTANHQVNM